MDEADDEGPRPNRPLKRNPFRLQVSPDAANRQLAQDCSPATPMLINQRCKLTAWDGLYHDFWDK